MQWLYPTNGFNDLAYEYFNHKPKEPMERGRYFEYTGRNPVINADATMIYHIWDQVFNKSAKSGPDVLVWVPDLTRLELLAGSGLFLTQPVTEEIVQWLMVQESESSKVSSLPGYAKAKLGVSVTGDTAEELLQFFPEIHRRGINHLAFRGLTDPGKISERHLYAIARLFNARMVSVPTLKGEFRKYTCGEGEKMSKLHDLFSPQTKFYGKPPAEILVNPRGTIGGNILCGTDRPSTDIKEFLAEEFRFGNPPSAWVSDQFVLYGLVRNAANLDFVFPGNPEYTSYLQCKLNDKFVPGPVMESNAQKCFLQRIRENHRERVDARRARRAARAGL
jgi:hypothetical protein